LIGTGVLERDLEQLFVNAETVSMQAV